MFSQLIAQTRKISFRSSLQSPSALVALYALALLMAATLFFVPGYTQVAKAGPTVFTVNSLGDADAANPAGGICATSSGGCTLRAAIEVANNSPVPATINFAIDGTIFLGTALPPITTSLTIDGSGRSIAIDGNNYKANVFTIKTANTTINLQYLTIQNGYNSGVEGGAIHIVLATVNISHVVFNNNIVDVAGGGAISIVGGNLNISDSIFTKNQAIDTSGNGNQRARGGALLNIGSSNVTVTNTTFNSNFSTYAGGVIFNNGNMTIINSSFDNNKVSYMQGYTNPNYGGAIYQPGGNLTVENSTISNNYSEGYGGGIYIGGGTANLINTTVTNNSANALDYYAAGGIYVDTANLKLVNSTISDSNPSSVFGNNSTVNVTNSILNDLGSYFGKAPVDNGGNVFANANANLGPLQNNGGPTLTRLPQWGSPAIDNGLDSVCAAAMPNGAGGKDQRGVSRPQWTHCDSGAAEFDKLLVVNSLEDSADSNVGNGICAANTSAGVRCTLRSAIQEANATTNVPIIVFSVSGIIRLGSNLPAITTTGGLTIDGSGQKLIINGNNSYRVFTVNNGANFTLKNIGVYNGYDPASGGGLINNGGGTTSLVNTTFGFNRTNDDGVGGAVNNFGTLTAINSTFSTNHSGSGGAISNSGTLKLFNVTTAANEGMTNGGTIYSNGGSLSATNSILTRNFFGDSSNGVLGPYTDGGGNLVDTNIALGPLQDNGGSTATHALLAGSPAIDRGVNYANLPAIDQRGQPHIGQIDIGAYEAPATTIKTLSVSPASASIAVGQTKQFSAAGVFAGSSNGTDITTDPSLNWSSSNTGIASISNNAGNKGLATGLGAGNSNISASYGGLNAGAALTVTPASTAISLAVNPGPTTQAGQNITLTATLSPTVAGLMVQFLNNGTVLATAPTNSSGQAVVVTNTLAVGSYNLTARFNGTANYTASQSSPAVAVQINKIATSLAVSPAVGSYGGSVTLTATLTANNTDNLAGQPLSFTLGSAALCGGGGQPPCPQTDANGVATLPDVSLAGIKAGSYPGMIGVAFAGSSLYSATTASADLMVKTAQTTLTLTSSSNPASYGQNIIFTATVSPPTNSGTVTFKFDGTSQMTLYVDSEGVANCFIGNLEVGQHTVTATFNGNANLAASAPATLTETIIAGPPATVQIVSGDQQRAPVNTAFAQPLAVLVTDSGNNPVSGAVVTFSGPGSGPGGSFAGGSPVYTATTDSSGLVTATTFTANPIAGAYNLSANVDGVNNPAVFGLTNLPGSASGLAIVSGDHQQTVINTAFGNPLAVHATDGSGNAVSGVSILFSAPASGAGGGFAQATISVTVTTDGNGDATAPAFTANTVAGDYSVSAAIVPTTVARAHGLAASSVNFALTNLSGPANKVAVVSGNNQNTTVNTGFSSPLVVSVTDQYANPISGTTVTFAAPSGGPSATFASGILTATTGSNGQATSASLAANSVAGSYTVTASVSGVVTPATFTLTNTPGVASGLAIVSGDNQLATISTPFGSPLVAKVTDGSGNAVSGVGVVFSAPGNGSSASFGGNAVYTGTTDNSGVITTTVPTANSTSGNYMVNAALVSGTFPARALRGGRGPRVTQVQYHLTNLAGPPAAISVVIGSGQSAVVNTGFSSPLVARVTDSGANPVSGTVVTFTAPASGPSGSFAGGSGSPVYTGTTDASGLVTTTTFTANPLAGSYTVAATAGRVATPAVFSLINLAGCNPLVVTSTGDDGSCGTLRAALVAASTGPTKTVSIQLTAGSTITLTTGLTLSNRVAITTTAPCGIGAGNTLLPPVTIQGVGTSSGNGLTLAGQNRLYGLWVRGFSGVQIKAPVGSHTTMQCVKASKL